jgi:SAM-dependent methyltransferase
MIQKIDSDYNLCRCGSCGYVFDSPRPTLDEVICFYSRPAKYDSWLDQEQARDALWKRRIKKLARHRNTGNLLDVGTGIGQFLHHAKPFFSEVHGTEVSESAIWIAKEKYGLEIYRGLVEELDLPPASFDNITLFHVLEHVPDPVRLVQTCRKLLRPNGILMIAVPNDVLAWTSLVKRLGKLLGLGAFQKFSPRLGIPKAGTSNEIHISHFTPTVLRQLLEGCGVSILEESLDPYYAETAVKLFIHAAYYSIHRMLWTLFKKNRYDTIWMVAKKPEAI